MELKDSDSDYYMYIPVCKTVLCPFSCDFMTLIVIV